MYVHEDWLLTPYRAAIHLPTATAVIADLHLGYDQVRQRGGEAVPSSSFEDIVANEICSYESDVPPGGRPWQWTNAPRPVCENIRLTSLWPRFAFIHGNYVGDERFWNAVLPTLTS